jgi:outer membrane protein assembly factor BamD (BamD/ComL family)
MRYLAVIIVLTAVLLSGCTGQTAEELFETAQFEELQMNQEHAEELYRKIVEKHPESEYAKKARDRLLELKNK